MKYQTKVILGAQWGDEGKGKMANYYSQRANYVVRFQGGSNAGHTIAFNKQTFHLQQLPSGIFNPQVINVLAQGVVVNPAKLVAEVQKIKALGFKEINLLISDKAHIVMPYHLDLDQAYENTKLKISPSASIGTTKQGIGPCYEDKYARLGIRMIDLINPQILQKKLQETLVLKNKVLKAFDLKPYDPLELFQEYQEFAKFLQPFVVQTEEILETALKNNKKVIFEGAQGTLLSIENGSYPYVTSSSPSIGGVILGTGLSLKYFHDVIGIVKAYSTRVGAGAMPTEIKDLKLANHLRERGNEYGTVSKRPRRIGFLDCVILKESIRLNGFTEIILTLVDVLSDLEEIKLATHYNLNGKEIAYVPASDHFFQKAKPLYVTVPGWKKEISNIKDYQKMPFELKNYVNLISQILKVKISHISVGPYDYQTLKVTS